MTSVATTETTRSARADVPDAVAPPPGHPRFPLLVGHAAYLGRSVTGSFRGALTGNLSIAVLAVGRLTGPEAGTRREAVRPEIRLLVGLGVGSAALRACGRLWWHTRLEPPVVEMLYWFLLLFIPGAFPGPERALPQGLPGRRAFGWLGVISQVASLRWGAVVECRLNRSSRCSQPG